MEFSMSPSTRQRTCAVTIVFFVCSDPVRNKVLTRSNPPPTTERDNVKHIATQVWSEQGAAGSNFWLNFTNKLCDGGVWRRCGTQYTGYTGDVGAADMQNMLLVTRDNWGLSAGGTCSQPTKGTKVLNTNIYENVTPSSLLSLLEISANIKNPSLHLQCTQQMDKCNNESHLGVSGELSH